MLAAIHTSLFSVLFAKIGKRSRADNTPYAGRGTLQIVIIDCSARGEYT